MTVTIKKMSAGKGYEYLLRTLVAGDWDRSLSTPLTRYYTEEGTPPSRWMGSGVASLESHINEGDEVTEEQLRLLIGEGKHPVTGEHLGRKYRIFKKPEEGKRRHPVAGAGTCASPAPPRGRSVPAEAGRDRHREHRPGRAPLTPGRRPGRARAGHP